MANKNWFKSMRIWLDEPVDITEGAQKVLRFFSVGYDYDQVTLKITPERNLRNYTNSNIIAALGDLYENFAERTTVHGFRVHYKMLPRLQFDIMYEVDKITFYFTVPKRWKNLFVQKIESSWEGVGIEEINEMPKFDENNTQVAEMKYVRHNIFSINTARDDNDPLNDQLATVEYMKEMDKSRVSISMECTSLKDWFDISDDAYKELKEGKLPKRDYQLLTNKSEIFWRGMEWIIRDFANFILEMFTDKGSEYGAPKDPQAELIMANGRPSKSTSSKLGSAVFKTSISILSEADDKQRAETTLRSLGNSYRSLNEDNELVRRDMAKEEGKKRIKDVENFRRIKELDPNLMSALECGKLTQLPTAGLLEKYGIEHIEMREFQIPEVVLDPTKGIPFSIYPYRKKDYMAYIPTYDHDELCLPTVVVAGMGQGKTKGFASNMALEMFRKGYSVICPDVAKGEIIEQILAVVTEEELKKIIILDLSNQDYPIPLDWSEVYQYNQRMAYQRLTSELAHFLKNTADEAGDRTRMYLELAAKTVFSIPGTTILDIAIILQSKKYRDDVLAKIDDPGIKVGWLDYENLTDAQQREYYRPILFRLNTIMGDIGLKNIICQPAKKTEDGKPMLNFRQLMDEGYMVLIKAKKTTFGEQGLNDLMAFLTAKVWLAALTRDEDGDYKPCVYLLDEPQQYLEGSAKHFEQMFTESRKWRLKVTFLFHSWAQLKQKDKELPRILKSALCHWHIYSTSDEELKDMKTIIEPYTIEEAVKVKRHWAINHMRINGEYHTFISRMIFPPKDRLPNTDQLHHIADCSSKYGTWYEDVQKGIYDKERALFLSIAEEARQRKNKK